LSSSLKSLTTRVLNRPRGVATMWGPCPRPTDVCRRDGPGRRALPRLNETIARAFHHTHPRPDASQARDTVREREPFNRVFPRPHVIPVPRARNVFIPPFLARVQSLAVAERLTRGGRLLLPPPPCPSGYQPGQREASEAPRRSSLAVRSL